MALFTNTRNWFILALISGLLFLGSRVDKLTARIRILENQVGAMQDRISELKDTTNMLVEKDRDWLLVETREMIVTGYSNDRYSVNVVKWRDGKTATNKPVREGICAADWKHYPVGTIFYIPDYGVCEVQDRGGLIKGENRLDLFFSSRREALKWGVKRIRAIIIRPNLKEAG